MAGSGWAGRGWRAAATLLLAVAACGARGQAPATEYLAQTVDRIPYVRQGWGELGIDTCAHAAGQAGLPLQIGSRTYARGLGHHAPGEIVVDLDGQYRLFQADVGVQLQRQRVGSVVFRVYVDGNKRFDSGVMRDGGEPKAVRVSVEGAQELRLVATDAGDGITCDCADWAEARLERSAHPAPPPAAQAPVDVAPFARLVTWDPARMDGARADRVHEYRAEDLFLERAVPRRPGGTVAVPFTAAGGCIGLQWLERRPLRAVGIRLGPGSRVPSTDGVEVQGWFGESPRQGVWKPLKGSLAANGDNWEYTVGAQGRERTALWKVRWVFPASAAPVTVRALTAFTRTRWDTSAFTLIADPARFGRRATVTVYNGAIAGPSATRVPWTTARPLALRVRHDRQHPWHEEPTVLRIQYGQGGVAVAVADVLAHGRVFVPDAGLLVTTDPRRYTLASCRSEVARGRTVLQRVRSMPDQTFDRALARTHHVWQDSGPMLLSLSWDNRKFLAPREGGLRFEAYPEEDARIAVEPLKHAHEMRVVFGTGKPARLKRSLYGGWLPVPTTTVEDAGVTYTQRAFVAPFGSALRPLCVTELAAAGGGAGSQPALRLEFGSDGGRAPAPSLERGQRGVVVRAGERLIALVDTTGGGAMSVEVEGAALRLAGTGARCVVYVPGWKADATDADALRDAPALLRATEDYWRGVMAGAAEIRVPDARIVNAIRASQVHCLIAARNEAGGERVAPWIAAMVYGPLESECNSIIRGMDLLGHHDFARRSLDYYVHRYSPEGYLTTGYTLMGTGWHLWTLGEHVALTRDAGWLRSVAPDVARVCRWIMAQRRKTMRPEALAAGVYGLMPPGVMADWNAFSYYFCLNGYYCAGLEHAAEALASVGDPSAPAALRDAEQFRRDIRAAYRRTQAITPVLPLQNGAWVPGYPSQVDCPGPTNDFYPGEDSNRSWCYDIEVGAHQLVPQGVLPAGGPEATRIMDQMEDAAFLAEGWFDYPAEASHKDWFDLGGFSKVQPYYTRNAEIYAMRDDVKPFVRSYFNTLAAMLNTENLSLWEHFHASGAWNKTHETGYFLQQSRFMMLMERGDDLWLAPLITSNWLKDGRELSVRNAPTRFGPVAYRIVSHTRAGTIEATIDPPTRTPPAALILRLRHPEGKRLRRVIVNGVRHTDFDADREIVRLRPQAGRITVRAEY